MVYKLEVTVNGTRMGKSQGSFFLVLKNDVHPKAPFTPLNSMGRK